MRKNNLLILISLAFVLSSCSMKVDKGQQSEDTSSNEKLLHAVLFQQMAAEYDALAYQAFNLARKVVLNDMKISMLGKQQAIIIDIDETVLDNSPYEAECILENINYPEKWTEWIEKADAKAIPGALEFLRFASKNSYEIFYVTNRKDKFREATLRNLKKIGFPYVDNDHLFMRTTTSDKQPRRDLISKDHRIVLLIGDNLDDFSEVFYKKLSLEREELVDSLKNEFGNSFVILPNAMYGSWQQALIEKDKQLSDEELKKILYDKLKDF